jgi:Rps23 Pro-64 3,4-dihydroxylase Tpa1-like proline 4-hydroxylase
MTSLFWYYREPKSYKGGNLGLHDHIPSEDAKDPEMIIESKRNCLVMFPSVYAHSVDKIEMIDGSEDGRFTVSTFFEHDPRFTQDTRELP